MSEGPKACPFCQCSAVMSLMNGSYRYAYCRCCEARGPLCETDAQALAAWNRRPTLTEEQKRACTWTYQGEPEYCWDTQCGEKFQFMEGGPKENNTRFCCYCGGSLAAQEKQP